MKIDASITLLFGEDGLRIEIRDNDSAITFFRGRLNAAQTCMALSRLGNTPMVKAETYGLDNVGKNLEMSKLEIELPDGIAYEVRKSVATNLADKQCPDGWVPDNYYGSQDSFFTRDGINYAKTTIRRYV